MANVTVKFYAGIREAAGMRTRELEAEDIRGLLSALREEFGDEFMDVILDDETGDLKRFYSCMINGKRIELLDGYDTPLEDGDRVALFPPVGGG